MSFTHNYQKLPKAAQLCPTNPKPLHPNASYGKRKSTFFLPIEYIFGLQNTFIAASFHYLCPHLGRNVVHSTVKNDAISPASHPLLLGWLSGLHCNRICGYNYPPTTGTTKMHSQKECSFTYTPNKYTLKLTFFCSSVWTWSLEITGFLGSYPTAHRIAHRLCFFFHTHFPFTIVDTISFNPALSGQ